MERISEERVNEIVAQTVADLAFEGMVCDNTDKAAMRRIVRGETTEREEVEKVLSEHKKEV